MSSLVSSRSTSQYTDEQRREAIAVYAVKGNALRTGEYLNIPERTVNQWIKTEWGIELLATIRDEKQQEFDAQITTIIHEALEQQLDRVQNGDYILDKHNELKRKPMSGKDLATTMGIDFDKRQLGRGKATSISTNSSALDNIAKRLEELAKAEKGTLIEGERVEESGS